MQSVIPEILDLFSKLESTTKDCFFYNLFGENVPPKYRDWVSLLIKQGGTTIPKLEKIVELNYKASTYEYSHLIGSLNGRDFFDGAYHTGTMKKMSEMTKVEKAGKFEKILKGVQSKIY